MKATLPLRIDRQSWLAYLGVRGPEDSRLQEDLAQAERLLLGTARPRATITPAPLDALNLQGQSIRKHLAGAHSMILMGVTLGPEIDLCIRRAEVRDMGQALLLDTGASVLVDQVADLYQDQVQGRVADHLTQRFSPGYGDLPLATQAPLLRLLDGPRRIGLTVTPNHILVPRKSITAILGVSDTYHPGHLATCDECLIRDICQKRKEGRACHA